MSQFYKKYGNWAMVAGAALGLGESFCTTLAKQGFNIIMIDNQEDSMNTLSDNLIKRYNIKTLCLLIDLNDSNSFAQIIQRSKDINCRLLIYNAAFSRIKRFIDHTNDELDHFLNVNIGSQLKLVHAFSNHLIQKNQHGGIILMSSLAGLLGMQLIVPYAASKAFAWNLAEALHHELKPFNIDVMACIAGATSTEAYLKTNPQYGFFKPQVQQPMDVAEMALKKLGKRALFISGSSNRFSYFILTRILPRKLAARLANKTMRKMYTEV